MQGLAKMKGKRFGAIVGDSDVEVDFPLASLTAMYGIDDAMTKTRTSIERAALDLLRRLAP
jgi:hypothetical protein